MFFITRAYIFDDVIKFMCKSCGLLIYDTAITSVHLGYQYRCFGDTATMLDFNLIYRQIVETNFNKIAAHFAFEGELILFYRQPCFFK